MNKKVTYMRTWIPKIRNRPYDQCIGEPPLIIAPRYRISAKKMTQTFHNVCTTSLAEIDYLVVILVVILVMRVRGPALPSCSVPLTGQVHLNEEGDDGRQES